MEKEIEVSEKVEEKTPEEQLKEMNKAVEKVEEKKDEEISKKADEQFKVEEGRDLTPQQRREQRFAREKQERLDNWVPKTELGRMVRAGKIKDIDEIFKEGKKIMEPQIVDLLLPNLQTDVLFIGQSKGKFGGGKRRAFRQTQKVNKEGASLSFGVLAVVGDGKGHLGLGLGKAGETLPAKEKAIRKAKLAMAKIPRGCASYDCSCDEEHSVPISTEGKCSSVTVKLMPAPQGTGLVVSDELKKIMRAAGIKDIYSHCEGRVRTTFNTAKACVMALNKLNDLKL
ncbi:30S ribosomal protein S5 [Candidatus Pacearchaeota archaeon]|nr:30S ribosomal protein S5 [Candidatus Pacearchaeota archaeon]